jgi:hypothetical protein
MKRLHVFTFVLFFSTYALADCPLGAKEDHLTIQRIMRNFGRFVTPADMVTIKGVNPAEKVSDAELTDAIENLGKVIDCAQAVLDHPEGDLLPAESRRLEGSARKDYLDDFLLFMTDFRDGLKEYREMFQKTLLQKAPDRDYKPLRQKCIELDNLVEHAHKKT